MTSYLVVDTESSGLFTFKDEQGHAVPADAPGEPRLASISMLFVSADMKLEREYHALIKPDGWTMTPGATEVNGLTDAMLAENGVPVREVLEEWRAAIKEGRVVVAHHAQHDAKQLRAELRRAATADLFEETKTICTMRTMMGIVKGKKGWPKLSDVLTHFGLPLTNDHTSGKDAFAVYGILRCMVRDGLLKEGKIHYAAVGGEKKRAKANTMRGMSLGAGLQASAAKVANENDPEDF